MKCSQVYARIGEWVDGTLDDAVARQVASHARSCERCAEAARRHRSLIAMLDAMPREAPAAGFADRVMARFRGAGRAPEPMPVLVATGGRASWLHPSLRAPVLAALALLVALALFPTTIQPLTAFVGKGAVVVANGVFSARSAVAKADVWGGVADSVVRNMQLLRAVLEAAFVLLAKVGEFLLIPVLTLVVLLCAILMVFVRGGFRRGAGASFSF